MLLHYSQSRNLVQVFLVDSLSTLTFYMSFLVSYIKFHIFKKYMYIFRVIISSSQKSSELLPVPFVAPLELGNIGP